MTDHFATLQQPRRPWLDPELLKTHFHRLTATLHPDVPGTGDAEHFTALNAAYTTLRDPVLRLRHLLALVFPETVAQPASIPEVAAALFARVAGLRREADDFRERQAKASSALAQALLAGDRADLLQRLQATLETVSTAHHDLLEELRALDPGWEQQPTALVAVHAGLSYLAKWSGQLRETIFQITEA